MSFGIFGLECREGTSDDIAEKSLKQNPAPLGVTSSSEVCPLLTDVSVSSVSVEELVVGFISTCASTNCIRYRSY